MKYTDDDYQEDLKEHNATRDAQVFPADRITWSMEEPALVSGKDNRYNDYWAFSIIVQYENGTRHLLTVIDRSRDPGSSELRQCIESRPVGINVQAVPGVNPMPFAEPFGTEGYRKIFGKDPSEVKVLKLDPPPKSSC